LLSEKVTPISGVLERELAAGCGLRLATALEIQGAFIPHRVFTQVRRETGKE
jgi:hypothetical protein